jgi:hypothetical protein
LEGWAKSRGSLSSVLAAVESLPHQAAILSEEPAGFRLEFLPPDLPQAGMEKAKFSTRSQWFAGEKWRS